MSPGLALTLKLLACVSFGAAAAFFVMMLYRIAGLGQAGQTTYAGTSMRRRRKRRQALASSAVFRFLAPWLQALGSIVSRMGLEPLQNYFRTPYAQAGYPGGLEDTEVVALGFLVGLVVMVFLAYSIAILWHTSMIWLALFGIPVGMMLLAANLKSRAAARELQILRSMPYVLDLLVLILRSGTSLSIALARVVEDYMDHPVGEELGQVLAEIEMARRVEAFRRFASRLTIPDVTSLADAIVQSEELGWPLAETLEHLADRLASERILRAEATAGAAGVLVMLPSTLVLAAAVLLLFGPLIVHFLSAKGGL